MGCIISRQLSSSCHFCHYHVITVIIMPNCQYHVIMSLLSLSWHYCYNYWYYCHYWSSCDHCQLSLSLSAFSLLAKFSIIQQLKYGLAIIVSIIYRHHTPALQGCLVEIEVQSFQETIQTLLQWKYVFGNRIYIY